MTAVTDEARARSREQRRARIAANPNRLCPPSHKHGATSTCFNAHFCRCAGCRGARAVAKRAEYYAARSITGGDVKMSAVGAQRRLQALAFMGWSCEAIAVRIGSHYRPLNRLRDGGRDRVMRSTHDRIDKVFRELAAVTAPGHSGRVTRALAKRNGFLSAFAWEGALIDDPNARADTDGTVHVYDFPDGTLDRAPDIRRMWGAGASDQVIATALGCAVWMVERDRKLLGLQNRHLLRKEAA